MKRIAIIILIFLTHNSIAQSDYKIGNFDKVVVSPHINVVLVKGNESSVKIEAKYVDPDLIVVNVLNEVLSIYLEGARYHEKNDRYDHNSRRWKEDSYQHAEVTAYVTFEDLRAVQVRGDQFLRCMDILDQRELKITLYGEVEATFAELNLREFKMSLYGDNEIEITKGVARDQIIRCYGDNEVNLSGLKGDDIKTNLFGDNYLQLFANDEIKLTSFGDSEIEFLGEAYVSKGIVIGDTEVSRLKIN